MKSHLKKGYRVFIDKTAAKTIRDDLTEVKSMGFDVVEHIENPDLYFYEINFKLIKKLLEIYNDYEVSYFVAVQDHGFEQGQPDRITRMNFLEKFLKNGLKKAFFSEKDDIPVFLSRYHSIYDQLKRNNIDNFVITDTAIVAALGATYNAHPTPCVTVDIGNGHTFACIVDKDYNVLGFFEHHTKLLTPEKFMYYISKLISGTLTNEEIFNDNGHGARIFANYSFENLPVLITGPLRRTLTGESDNFKFASPLGDMMITGPVGLFMQQELL